MAPPEVHERLAIIETTNSQSKEKIKSLEDSIHELTSAVNKLTARIDCVQNMFIGGAAVFTAIGAFISYIAGSIAKILGTQIH